MKISVIQLGIKESEKMKNRFQEVERILENMKISNEIPDLIMLPEVWGCGFFNFSDYTSCAEDQKGQTYSRMSHWAKELGCMIHSGSFIEYQNGKFYNTSLLFDKTGHLLAEYRKIHLFGYESEEQKLLTRGEQTTVVNTEFGNIGMATCYDLRFPEQFRQMAENNADIFLITSAWPMQRLNHWRLFNQVRALENQSFLVSCNCGFEQEGSHFAGHSMCVSPMGEILYEAGEEPTVLKMYIDLTQIKRYREEFPALLDRIKLTR